MSKLQLLKVYYNIIINAIKFSINLILTELFIIVMLNFLWNIVVGDFLMELFIVLF